MSDDPQKDGKDSPREGLSSEGEGALRQSIKGGSRDSRDSRDSNEKGQDSLDDGDPDERTRSSLYGLEKTKTAETFSGHSDDDLDALDSFCQDLDFEDMSFDDFCELNESLNLQFKVSLNLTELKDGGTRTIEYTRTLTVKTESGLKVRKEKVFVEVVWRKGAKHGDVIMLEGKGDIDHLGQSGTLLLTLEAK